MSFRKLKALRLSGRDLDFLVETVSPEVTDKARLKQIIREDEDFRNTFVADPQVFRKLMDDDEILLKISPTLFFEILLRRAASDLSQVSYTLEKNRTMQIPIFDAKELVELLTRESVLIYLADMLSSLTRIETYTVSFRIKKGTWKKIRFNDLDIRSLMSFCEAVEDEYRLGLYKRIADICLFILGIFPDYAQRDYRYPLSGEVRPSMGGMPRFSPQDYETEGQRFYQLAAEHPSAKDLHLSDVFGVLHANFHKARKPLNFIAEHYLPYKRHLFFA
ncbi:MAG: hypothetical protein JSW39_25505 [Desulfobacterales bacterium]|nr:MAG: hypothetical protein JSW39_25505 [Desulfobacterales bacterium]